MRLLHISFSQTRPRRDISRKPRPRVWVSFFARPRREPTFVRNFLNAKYVVLLDIPVVDFNDILFSLLLLSSTFWWIYATVEAHFISAILYQVLRTNVIVDFLIRY